MKQLRRPKSNAVPPCVATIGNFDGIHLGHQSILNELQAISREKALPSLVISFTPLPAAHFSNTSFPLIYPRRDKAKLLAEWGVNYFLEQPFDDDFASIDAKTFIKKLLCDHWQVKHLIIGDDFRFGRGRLGGLALLEEVGQSLGLSTQRCQTFIKNNHRVSSTIIRESLAKTDLTKAQSLLGRPYALSGRVRHGDKKGRTIGFPTLNMKIRPSLATPNGVYATTITGLDEKELKGVSNLGTRPTVAGTELRLETHIFDWSGDAYGKYVTVTLHEFLRPEQNFSDFATLQEQIARDAKIARTFFSA